MGGVTYDNALATTGIPVMNHGAPMDTTVADLTATDPESPAAPSEATLAHDAGMLAMTPVTQTPTTTMDQTGPGKETSGAMAPTVSGIITGVSLTVSATPTQGPEGDSPRSYTDRILATSPRTELETTPRTEIEDNLGEIETPQTGPKAGQEAPAPLETPVTPTLEPVTPVPDSGTTLQAPPRSPQP